jgi:spore germination protein YaaH
MRTELVKWLRPSAPIVAGLTLLMIVGATPASACAPALPATGYAENGTAPARVNASAPALATLGVDGVNIDAAGDSVPLPDSDSLALLRQARQKHLRAEFLLGNYSDAIGDFDPDATTKLVSSPANRAAVIATVVKAIRTQGWDGVQIDLEAIKGSDRANLLVFLTELKKALPKHKTLSMAVTAFTDAQEYADNGYDLAGLGRILDQVALMAYDEHGPTWNGVGPIGGLPWQTAALRLVLAKIPADKLDLGVAGYGYTWPVTGTGDQVSDAQARQLVSNDHSVAHWDATQGEWTATLHNGTVMWWSDARSWPLRESLARRYHLHGMALWSLGLSDPIANR